MRRTGSEKASRPEAIVFPPGLLERARTGKPEALGEFFDLVFDHVFSLVYRLLGERATAEDVTIEVFVKVQNSIDHLDPQRDPVPWLHAIAVNACKDYWRSHAHRMRTASVPLDHAAALSLVSRTDDPAELAESAERDQLVQEAISRLPETLRVAVVLHDYEGLGHEEIARLCGVGHAAMRKRYSRALEELEILLKGMWRT